MLLRILSAIIPIALGKDRCNRLIYPLEIISGGANEILRQKYFFGRTVTNTVRAKVDLNENVVEILDQ